jgi:DNA-binding CsgD family transcriptional regulator
MCLLFVGCRHAPSENKTLLTRADSLMKVHPDSALHLLKTITHPQELSSSDHALYALLLSQAFDKCHIAIESDSLISIATDYFAKSNENERAAYAFLYLSRCERNKENNKGQADALLKSIPFATKSNNQKLLGHIYNDKASIYKNQQQLDSMLYYYQLSLSAFRKGADRRNSTLCLLDIGYCYYLRNSYNSALYYYKIAEREAIHLKNPVLLSSIYRLTGVDFYYLHNYPMALYYTHLSAIKSDSYDYDKWKIFAIIFIQTKQLDSARIYLHKCILSGNETTECYRLLQEIDKKQGDLEEALHYAKLANLAKDSVNRKSLSVSFAGLEKKYNYERMMDENNQLMIRKQHYLICFMLSLLVFFIATTVVLVERNRKKKLALRNEEDQSLIRQQKLEIDTEQVNKVTLLKKMIQLHLIPENNLSQIGAQYLKLFDGEQIAIPTNMEELVRTIDGIYNGFSLNLEALHPALTRREIQICCCLRAGFDPTIICSILEIQSETYYHHRSRIRQKLGVSQDEKIEQRLAEI